VISYNENGISYNEIKISYNENGISHNENKNSHNDIHAIHGLSYRPLQLYPVNVIGGITPNTWHLEDNQAVIFLI